MDLQRVIDICHMYIVFSLYLFLGMSVTGKIIGQPIWHSYKSQNGELLDMAFEYSDLIWPWSGYLAVYVMVSEQGKNFEGIAQGHISLIIESPMEEGNTFSNCFNKSSKWNLLILYTKLKYYTI